MLNYLHLDAGDKTQQLVQDFFADIGGASNIGLTVFDEKLLAS